MNNFQSRDGITIVDVRAELAKQKAVIQRDKAYTVRRWIVSVEGHDDFYIRYIPTMGEMLGEIKKLGVIKFCKTHEASHDGRTPKVRKQAKETKKVAACAKVKKKRVDIPKLQEMEARHIDMVLERMNLKTTPERRKELADEMKILRKEIEALGGSHEIGSAAKERQTYLTTDDLKAARKRGEEKKKLKKEKNATKKNKTTAIKIKPGKAKKVKVEDDFDEDDELNYSEDED